MCSFIEREAGTTTRSAAQEARRLPRDVANICSHALAMGCAGKVNWCRLTCGSDYDVLPQAPLNAPQNSVKSPLGRRHSRSEALPS